MNQPVYLLSFGQTQDRWQVALKTAVATHYFVTLEELMLFLAAHVEQEAAQTEEAQPTLILETTDPDVAVQ